jgi:8-oxo-dGTP pyrophosphatase MutT (NUDIX family)
VAYITRGDLLLVFDQKGAKHPGFQVPAGTLEPGEDPAAGALREAREETGLEQLTVVRALGAAERDMRDFGFNQVHQRHFFHILCEQDTPATWRHTDPDPSLISEELPLLPFDFQWVTMPGEVPHLVADFGYHLPSLYQALGIKDQA